MRAGSPSSYVVRLLALGIVLLPSYALAVDKVIFLTTTGAGTWTVPSDWTNTNTIEVIGGGGSGGYAGESSEAYGGGGGGGGYAKITNFSSTAGASVSYQVGAGGNAGRSTSNGSDTWFSSSATVKGAGGTKASVEAITAGTGGTANVGDVTANGGNGGNGFGNIDNNGRSGGGGGAGGPSGAGVAGAAGVQNTSYGAGGAGNNGSGGAGGSGGETGSGSNGSAGTGWTQTSNSATAGSGGGGGGGSWVGHNGGLYGGGGGGGTNTTESNEGGGAGGQGIIVITYTAADVVAPTVTTQSASVTGQTTATANGNITATGGASATSRGFAYGTSTTLSGANVATTTASGTFSTGAFTGSLTGLTCGTTYYSRAYAVNSAGTSTGAISSSFTTDACDTTAPAISAVAVSTTTSSATITWTTDEAASSRIYFGPSSSLGTSTALLDTSPRVTSHSITLNQLVSCKLYHYQIESIDANSNTGTTSVTTFRIPGCTTTATVQSEQSSNIATSTGGTVTQANLTLSVPTGFSNASSTITFQATEVEGTAYFAAIAAPTGKRTVGSSVFTLAALSDATTTVSSFSAALTITFTYEDSEISGVNESTLVIYRYDGSTWSALTGCSVNTSANTVSCQTTQFSDFALFGSPQSNGPVYSGSSSSLPGYVVPMPVLILASTTPTTSPQSSSNAELLAALTAQLRALLGQLAALTGTSQSSSPYTFTRDLELGDVGEDVRALQQFLNAKGFIVASEGEGSPGNEGTRFGTLTYRALIRFQEANGIVPAAGYFGAKTRAAVSASQ